MFDDIIEGSKGAGDITLNFFSGIAKKIQDKLFDQAADQLTAGVFEAFGLSSTTLVVLWTDTKVVQLEKFQLC